MEQLPSNMAIASVLAAVAAVGTAITGITEVLKRYVPGDKVPPPIVAALLAAIVTALYFVSQAEWPVRTDALTIFLVWYALFNTSIGVYHLNQVSQGRQAGSQSRSVVQEPNPDASVTTTVVTQEAPDGAVSASR